jgi:hypothetical protein
LIFLISAFIYKINNINNNTILFNCGSGDEAAGAAAAACR